jgi:hypothetical protein
MENSFFIAKVLNVYIKDEITSDGLVIHQAGTMDVLPVAHHMGSRGVRTLSSSLVTKNGVTTGFSWIPSVGSWVVCACLEDYKDSLICLGVLRHASYSTMPVMDGKPLQYEDCVLQHETQSFLRFRNLDTIDDKGNSLPPSKTQRGRSEILIKHVTGDSIEITEPNKGSTEISITHHSGATAKIDTSGNIILTPASGKQLKLGGSSASQGVALGDSLNQWLLMHTHPTGVGPSGPPMSVPPATSKVVKVIP